MTLKERSISIVMLTIGYLIMVSVAREYIALVDVYLFERRIIYVSILIPIAIISCNVVFQAPLKDIYGNKALFFRLRQALYFVIVMSVTSVAAKNLLNNYALIKVFMIQIFILQANVVIGLIIWYINVYIKNAKENSWIIFFVAMIIFCLVGMYPLFLMTRGR